MTIFTISRQVGALGEQIAEEVARRTGAPLLDRARLTAEPAQYGVAVQHQPPLEITERGPTLLERLGGRPRYTLLLRLALYEFALRHESAVIVGLGGQIYFAPVRHALRVLLVAPFEARVERLLGEMADREAAEREVRHQDHERMGYHQYVHHADWLNPELYHLVVNTAEAEVEQVADLLLRVAELPGYQPTPESRQAFQDLALVARVEVALAVGAARLDRVVVRAEEGLVTVSGMLDTEDEQEQVERIVRETPGVQEVLNDLRSIPRKPA